MNWMSLRNLLAGLLRYLSTLIEQKTPLPNPTRNFTCTNCKQTYVEGQTSNVTKNARGECCICDQLKGLPNA